jgi:hypothetical protein
MTCTLGWRCSEPATPGCGGQRVFFDQAAKRAGAAIVQRGIGFDQLQDLGQELLQGLGGQLFHVVVHGSITSHLLSCCSASAAQA